MLYLLFVLVDAALGFKSPPDGVVIKKADIELNQLMLRKDSKRAAAYYSEDFILTTHSGSVKYKQDIVTEISSPELTLIVNETSNVEVRIAGSTAILTGTLHQKGSYRGKFFDKKFQITDTWVETPKGWKILAGHSTLRPPTSNSKS
jgi:ketosteroid isomerase-like protein